MKKLCLKTFLTACFFLITLLTIAPINIAYANHYTTYSYARINTDNVSFYKSAQESGEIYFYLPRTYFVLLLSSTNNFYKVQYRDIIGFVLKSDVTPVEETPQTPYLTNASFWIYSNEGTSVLNAPNKEASVIGSVEKYEEIDYYGSIYGDELIKNRGVTWYYCKTKEGKFGYLYEGLSDNLYYLPNTEKATPKNILVENDNTYLYNLVDLTPFFKFLLIAIVCLPSLVIIYLLFKPFKIEKDKKVNKKSKFKLKTQTINKIQKIVDDEPL